MRFQPLASIVSIMFVGTLFMAGGCQPGAPLEPTGNDKGAYQVVRVEVSGMT